MEKKHEEARTMKSKSILSAGLALVVAFVLAGAGQQNAEQLYKTGLYEEEVGGNLQKAIEIYQDILKRFPDNRGIAAMAQLHIGLCYEKLGTSEAEKAFQKVLDNYPEQSEAANMAKEKLVVFQKVRGSAKVSEGEFRIRRIGPLEVLGAPSPDGNLISCVDWDTGDLALYEVASGKRRRVTNKGSWAVSGDFAEESSFSPDGKSIAYNWYNSKDLRYDLRTINTDGTGQNVLYCGEDVNYIWPCGWTPDRKHILAIVTNNERVSRIALISASDGTARTIKDFKSGAPGKLSLSSDGQWIAFAYPNEVPWRTSSEKSDIYLLAVDGSREVPLVAHPADDGLLGWTPDGKSIFFSSDRSGTWDAWIQPVENGDAGGDPRLIRRDFGDPKIVPMGFTRDGSFYYGIRIALDDIYILSLDPATGGPAARAEKAALRFEGSNSCPCWSPDGDYLAYTSVRSQGRSEPGVLCIKSMISGEEREVHPAIKDFDTVAWFPDGKFILVRGVADGHRPGLFRVDTVTGEAEASLILDDMGGFHSPVLSRNGKRIFYDLDDWKNDTFRIMSYDLETKQKKELIRSSSQIIHYNQSPDGKWLAFKEGEGEEGVACLRTIPSEGGEKRTLMRLDKGEGINGIVWSPDGRYIYYSKWEEGSSKSEACSLWRIPAEGGKPEKYDLTVDGLGRLSFRPDGRKLAFNSWRIESEAWVMENFLPVDKTNK
jgi:Tol biopolymer transport system component